jgi:alpha-L-rhamnosidase
VSSLEKEKMFMNPLPPVRLKCEYLTNPLGIAEEAPRFSWVPEHPRRGARQIAAQVIVSPEKSFVEKEVGDYWDSGRVESDRTAGVRYGGVTLQSGKAYFWRVRWWDEWGGVSPWSETVSFEMGLLQNRDWKAGWISGAEVPEFQSGESVTLGKSSGGLVQSLALYLRREFEVKDRVRRARAYVSGLGWYELRLNGRKVGDRVLDPAPTDYKKVALYSVYDVTGLIQEKNAVAVILGNGRHIKNYGYGPPRLILQIDLEMENELTDRVITDNTWTVSSGPLLENGIYSGERYDGGLEAAGWDEAGFDDSAWKNAVDVPGAPLSSQLLPPVRVTETLKPVRLWSPQPAIFVADFGQNFSGWVRLKVKGPRGTEIKLRHAELVGEDGTLNVLPNQNAQATDIFVLKGGSEELYEPRFTYHGFRYVEISGFPGELTPDAIEGCFVHSDVEKTGDFACSNSLFDQVHRNVVWGQLSNLMGIPTDCPQRDERQGWLGDAHLSAEEAMLNFDMAAFYTKFLEDIKLAQKEDGSLPDVVPPYLEQLYPADPAWGMAYLELAWLMYFYYDDLRVLGRHYAAMKKYADFLARNSETHIIKTLGKYGDWCPPGSIAPARTPLELTSTWAYYRVVGLMATFAGILGRSDDARSYARLAEEIKTRFNARFLEEDQYTAHRISPVDKSPNQTSNVLPLALDMVPPEKKDRVVEKLFQSTTREWDFHLDTGIIGTRYLLDVLTDNGYGDVAFRIASQESYPGWGYMVREGATTLWERWEKQTGGGMNSHNHIMLGSVDAWFYRVVAGLMCASPGWRKIVVKPPLFPGLTRALAKVGTIRGEAGLSWLNRERAFSLDVRVPVGSTAEVYVPIGREGDRIEEGGTIIWPRSAAKEMPAGVSHLRTDSSYATFAVGSGLYRFTVERSG